MQQCSGATVQWCNGATVRQCNGCNGCSSITTCALVRTRAHAVRMLCACAHAVQVRDPWSIHTFNNHYLVFAKLRVIDVAGWHAGFSGQRWATGDAVWVLCRSGTAHGMLHSSNPAMCGLGSTVLYSVCNSVEASVSRWCRASTHACTRAGHLSAILGCRLSGP